MGEKDDVKRWEKERRWFVLGRPRRDTNGGRETEVTVTAYFRAERRWFVLTRPRSDTNGESGTEVTVTSKQHKQ